MTTFMAKNEHKYLVFPSVNVFKVCTVHGKDYTFPILFLQNIIPNKLCLMLENIKFSDTENPSVYFALKC